MVPLILTMRKIILKTNDGSDAGSITESDGGSLTGEGRGEKLVALAAGRGFDGWVESLQHTKYLQYEVQG